VTPPVVPDQIWLTCARELGEVAAQGLFTTDRGGALTYCNVRANEFAGAPVDVGRPWTAFVAEGEREAAEAWWREGAAGGAFPQQQWTSPTGKLGVFRAAAAGTGFVGSIEDITEQARTQQRRERFFVEALEMIGTVNLSSGQFERINPALERALAWPAELAIPGEAREKLLTGLPQSFESRHRGGHGVDRWIAWSVYPMLDTGIAYVFGRDVTAQQVAAEERHRLAELVKHSGDMIEMAELDTRIIYINPAGLEMVGWASVPENATLGDLLRQDRSDELLAQIRARQMQGEGWEGELEFWNRASNEFVPVHAKAFAIRNANGEPIARAFIARDMRSWRRAEAMLREAERLAGMGRVAATIAHEINNPLGAAVNLAYLLAQEPIPDAGSREMIAQLEAELNRVASVTRQTLGYFRNSKETIPVALGELLKGVVGAFSARAAALNVRVELHVDEPLEVEGSANELRQVLLNLIGNALDAMAATGGTLRIRLRHGKSWDGTQRPGARLTVADSGPGIAREDIERIFEPFFTRKPGGVGLGLWASAEIVRNHHGAIRVRAGTGSGAVFQIFLPRERAA
jgi:PAS domain S-box-containing protein